jgi:chromosome segregation ATPase
MARLGVTKDDVFAACKTLLKEGANLTVANVREELGTGSYTTLLPLIDAFKSSFKESSEKVAEGASALAALPAEISDHGAKFIQDIWWQASAQANKKIDEISAQLKKELADMAAVVAAKTEELSQVAGDITKLEKEADVLKADVEQKNQILNQKEGEIKLLKTQLKEKDDEVKLYLERSVAAEKRLEFFKEEKTKVK